MEKTKIEKTTETLTVIQLWCAVAMLSLSLILVEWMVR